MGNKINILIVEDTEFWSQQIIKSLDPKRFCIKHVTNLSDALSEIKKADPDAIVLDLQLPDSLFAKDTITAVMSVSHYTPVIACTAIDDDKLISQNSGFYH